MLVPAKNASSTAALSKPDIAPQSSPSARHAMRNQAAPRVPFRNAAASDAAGLLPKVGARSRMKVRVESRQNSVSYPMIAVTGAAIVLSRLPSERAGSSFAFPASLRTKMMRIGCEFADVGPMRAMSKAARSSSSGTSRVSSKAFGVRATRNRRSRAASSSRSIGVAEGGELGPGPGEGGVFGHLRSSEVGFVAMARRASGAGVGCPIARVRASDRGDPRPAGRRGGAEQREV